MCVIDKREQILSDKAELLEPMSYSKTVHQLRCKHPEHKYCDFRCVFHKFRKHVPGNFSSIKFFFLKFFPAKLSRENVREYTECKGHQGSLSV